MNTIKANLIELHVGGFCTKEDSKKFDSLKTSLMSMCNGIVITPIYNEDDELMSLIIDSKKAFELLQKVQKKTI